MHALTVHLVVMGGIVTTDKRKRKRDINMKSCCANPIEIQ